MRKYTIPGIIIAVICLAGFLAARNLPETIEREYRIEGEDLQVDIRIDAGEFELTRSDANRTVRVRIDYHPGRCKPHVSYESDDRRLELDVDHQHLFQSNDEGVARIYVELPSTPVTDLRAKITAGEMNFQLGDLSLRNCRIRSRAGELTVNFDQPNRIRMEKLDIGCSVGETDLENLGNARFRKARFNSGIGEMSVNFAGWADSLGRAEIDNDIGEMAVYIPRDVVARFRVSGTGFLTDFSCNQWFEKRGGYFYSRNSSDKTQNLDLRISSGIGELDIHSD